MNNCPKCGNPLQSGVTSCPICGTVIGGDNPVVVNPTPVNEINNQANVTIENTEVQTISDNTVQVQNVEPVVQVAPEVTQVPIESVQQAQVVEPAVTQDISNQPQNVVGAVSEVATPLVAAPVEQEPIQPQTVPSAVQESVTVATPEVVQTPSVEPVQQLVEQSPVVAPVEAVPTTTVEPVTATQVAEPVLAKETTPIVETPANQVPLVTDEKPKKKNKLPLLLVGLTGIAAIVVVAFMFLKGGNNDITPNNPVALETSSVNTNGYKFEMEKDWTVVEDSSNVIISNNDETVIIKLDHSATNINSISESLITNFLSTKKDYTDSSVTSTKVSSKDAYLINANINEMPVQIYFINGGSNLMIGITIVYQNNDIKKTYEANVTSLVNSLSYADDTSKAVSTLNRYSDIFNSYNGVINYREPVTQEPTTEVEEKNEENQGTIEEVTPEEENSNEQNAENESEEITNNE